MAEELLAIAKESEETKIAIRDKMIQLKDMNIATKAELATKLIIDGEIFRFAVNAAEETIYDLSLDNEILTEKNDELSKNLTLIEKNKIDAIFKEQKEKRKSNDSKKKRVLSEIRKTISKNKQLMQ